MLNRNRAETSGIPVKIPKIKYGAPRINVRKIKRLATWCKDINSAQNDYSYTPVYVKQEDWEGKKETIKTFAEVVAIFGVKPEKQINLENK